jgi:hypothetical protein
MNTKTISTHALSVINQYLHFKIGDAECSIPYFNNKTIRARASLRSQNGKGSPQEIYEEIQTLLIKNHIDMRTITTESLKKILTDNNIGIDCSAFAYYILNAESQEVGKGKLDAHIHFAHSYGLFGKIRCALRPIENCDVATFAHDKNSTVISIRDVQPGDIITMLGGPDTDDRNHILIIHQIEYQNFAPAKIHYVNSVAYPTDGVYGTGIKQGTIEIANFDRSIVEQQWVEGDMRNEKNIFYTRAQKSQTELRRMNFLKKV